MALRKPHVWLFAALLIYFLYFFHLTRAGMLGPDEPRYAAIGREMARSGDWVTPRLWGEPWFEKPALIYWMTGAAFRLGLSEDLAPRLPVALLSIAFLVLFFWILRREFGERVAWYSALILATSAGWIGLSQAGVPDIPLAAAFSAAILLSLRWIQNGDRAELPYASACLGLAVLAKGLVPLVLILPVLWVGRRRLANLFRPLVWAPFLAAAAPWYVACFLRNGTPFLEKFFGEHQFGRFFSSALLHGQPWWFYLPVILAGVFPWTPLLFLTFRHKVRAAGSVFLLVAIFGFLFFSLSWNKLPEYLLPLLPSLAALMGIALAGLEDRSASLVLSLCAFLAALVPLVADLLPQAIAGGASRFIWPGPRWIDLLPFLFCVLVKFLRPAAGIATVAAGVAAAVIFLKVVSLPQIDQTVSARPIWRQIAPQRDQVCVEQIHRRYRYGLNYYAVTPLPDCGAVNKLVHVAQAGTGAPEIR